MSNDVVVMLPPISDSDAQAWEELNRTISNVGPMPPVFRELYDRLTNRFPCPSLLADDELDNCAWNSGPLIHNFGARTAVLELSETRSHEVIPFLLMLASELGLHVFDCCTNLIHRADGLQRLKLTVEDGCELDGPTLGQLYSAVDSLTPDGGPGFMIVDDRDGDYTQTAGGDGAYVSEWRQYSPDGTFRHWVAGIAGQESDAEVQVRTNGHQVTVNAHEKLSAADVKRILSAFYQGSIRPPEFAWRDITDSFL